MVGGQGGSEKIKMLTDVDGGGGGGGVGRVKKYNIVIWGVYKEIASARVYDLYTFKPIILNVYTPFCGLA